MSFSSRQFAVVNCESNSFRQAKPEKLLVSSTQTTGGAEQAARPCLDDDLLSFDK
jgi:hypothetical protein